MATYKSKVQFIRGSLGIDPTDSCFSHGLLYVAISRIIDHRNLYICCADSTWSRTTISVVYREVLD